MELMIFSKHLAGPPLGEVASRLKAIGISSIDLTVRPGGHVEPGAAAEALPIAVEELAEGGVRVGMLSTGITDASDPVSRRVLETASALGIRYYKLGYYLYQGFGSLRKTRDEVRAKLGDLAALNLELGLTAGFHNHSDVFLGASLWDIDYLIQDLDPKAVGLYFDPCHAVIEGGSAGWEMGLDLLQDRVVMLAVKDFRWVDAGHGYAGARRHAVQFCPFEMGNVPWSQVRKHLEAIGFDGPVSFHSEYQGPFAHQDLTVDEVFGQTGEDVAWWQKNMA